VWVVLFGISAWHVSLSQQLLICVKNICIICTTEVYFYSVLIASIFSIDSFYCLTVCSDSNDCITMASFFFLFSFFLIPVCFK